MYYGLLFIPDRNSALIDLTRGDKSVGEKQTDKRVPIWVFILL